MEPKWVEDDFGRVELATIATYGDVVHTFVGRADTRARTCRATSRSRRRPWSPMSG
jgi:hypothetical protein